MYNELKHKWLNLSNLDDNLRQELLSMGECDLQSAFFTNLSFGTGGLRGTIGAGSNRMNFYTVHKATLGLASYVLNNYKNPVIAISYDSRMYSKEFAELAAATLANKGIFVKLFNQIMPTPMLSFAIKYLKCSGGIMITASHNPANYNGYKVYDHNACQITLNAANEIQAEIENQSLLVDNLPKFDLNNNIEYINDDVLNAYYDYILGLRLTNAKSSIKVVYSPLNGCGNIPISHVINSLGYVELSIVKQQQYPDPNFTTCPYPNPEEPKAMEIACKQAIDNNADICIASDPDCDRIGLGVNIKGSIELLSGNDVGLLLLDFIAGHVQKDNNKQYFVVKTIVSSDMAKDICKHYNLKLIEVLTGFKYIGEQIIEHENNPNMQFLFGFEESCGYLSGTEVRDKDAINAAVLICDMLSEYKLQSISLVDKLEQLKQNYGYYSQKLVSINLEGQEGLGKINSFMQSLRQDNCLKTKLIPNIDKTVDYNNEGTGLPKSDVLSFEIKNDEKLIIRPSGTEPKLKFYLFAKHNKRCDTVLQNLELIVNNLADYIEQIVV